MGKFSVEKKNKKWVSKHRPAFNKATKDDMVVKKGQHRRHVVPSHTLLNALTKYANKVGDDIKLEVEVDKFIQQHAVSVNAKDGLDVKLENVAKHLNNNQNNLFPEQGDENTAIGFLPKEISNLIARVDKKYPGAYGSPDLGSICDITEGLRDMKTKGFGFILKAKGEILDNLIAIITRAVETNLDLKYNEVRALLIHDITNSLELDLNKAQGSKTQTAEAVKIFQDLEKIIEDQPTAPSFFAVAGNFLKMPQT